MNNYIQIGFLGKTHGVKGELKIKIDADYIDDFNDTDIVFIKIKGQHVPYFIESVRAANSPIIKFEDTDSKESAAILQHQPFFLKEADVTVYADEPEELLYEHIVGFEMVDVEAGKLGKITAVEAYPQQEMAIVQYQGNDILIPLNEYIIIKISLDNQIVSVNLPHGLLDI